MAMLEGRVIAITGTASGMGLATAKLLAERVAIVMLADVNKGGLADALRSFPRTNKQENSATVVDVRDTQQVNKWIEKIVSEHGILDGAANIAGYIGGGDVPITEETDER
ncbi:hypothetical protein RBB50_012827 [Rhinocladiella similis]